MNDRLTLLGADAEGDDDQSTTGWRFSVIPPKTVWARWYRTAKTLRRPAGTLALPAIATTAALHFSHVLHDSDTIMTLGLTTLTVAYDAVIAVCRARLAVSRLAHRQDTTRDLRHAV